MRASEQRRRVERIQETGGTLRGGTVGNVWEWGDYSCREDALMEMSDDAFDVQMDMCETTKWYSDRVDELEAKWLAASTVVRVIIDTIEPHRKSDDGGAAWAIECAIATANANDGHIAPRATGPEGANEVSGSSLPSENGTPQARDPEGGAPK